MKGRLFGAVALVAAAALWGGGAASAAPIPQFDPLTTNVPYLAWRGEELRLVKCVSVGVDGADLVARLKDADNSRAFDADWLVEDWSGYPFQPPQLEKSTVSFFRGNNEHRGDMCVKADFTSQKAGLAQIKLVVSEARSGDPVLKHQFLAGWLSLNTPTIREVAATTTPGGGGVLGDPAGDGRFLPGGAAGRVQVLVTGHLPLDNNFRELGLPAAGINLPTESNGDTFWDDLARALATTSDPTPLYRDTPSRMWDIHDDQAATEGHVSPLAQCNETTTPTPAIDAVDACLGAEHFIGDGEYTRAFGDRSSFPTFGPFDPLRPDETLLPDGKLDAGDVPMPSALVEVGIAANTGAATDTGGVGSLAVRTTGVSPFLGVFKCIPYTRDHACTNLGTADSQHRLQHSATVPPVIAPPFGPARHNHYAPYYTRWIPATSATVGSNLDEDARIAREASGNDGPAIGNNFPGYRGSGPYDFWQFADILSTAADGPTHCLRRFNDTTPEFRVLPSGPQRVLVFSDEHGEAQVYFNPGTGFFFDNLVTPDQNGACDLRGIAELGHADITAIARYPFQKVTDPDKASATIRKTVGNLFRKDVSCAPKAGLTGPEANTAFICTATAIDIGGTPVANETVCFTAGGTGAEVVFSFPIGSPAERLGDFTICVRTNSSGQAQVEVLGKCGTGNVFALFRDERIIRVSNVFTFGCPTGGGTTTTTTTTSTTTTTTTPAGGGAGTAPGVVSVPAAPPTVIATLTQQVTQQATGGSQSANAPAAATRAKLAFARVEKKAFQKPASRRLVVRVDASARSARIQVTLVGRGGKTIGKATRVVPTNRTVRVNLNIPAKAVTVRVKVLG